MFYFIYETTNLLNGRKYRGYHTTENVEDGYLGSGNLIIKAVEKYGKENFKRVILEFCDSIDDVVEREKFYVDEEWVKDRNTYNLQLGGRMKPIDEETKKKVSETLKKKYANGEIQNPNKGKVISSEVKAKISKSLKKRYETHTHPSTGKSSWCAGTKGQGICKAWNKGLKLPSLSDEDKRKKSESLKKYYETNNHHAKGGTSWNKGLKMGPSWNSGIAARKFECPHCGKIVGGESNFKRWHNENCKKKGAPN